MKTPKQVASEIIVRTGPNRSVLYNGLPSLKDVVETLEPNVHKLVNKLQEGFLAIVASELNIRRVDIDAIDVSHLSLEAAA